MRMTLKIRRFKDLLCSYNVRNNKGKPERYVLDIKYGWCSNMIPFCGKEFTEVEYDDDSYYNDAVEIGTYIWVKELFEDFPSLQKR